MSDEVKPLYIDPECVDLERFRIPTFFKTEWITKIEALKLWPERTESVLECKNEKCRCKVRLKENEALKRE